MEDNKTRVAAGWDAYYRHDLDTLLATCADDCEVVLPGMPEVKGKDGIRFVWEAFMTAFPDEKPTQIRHVAEGDTVVTIWESTATHKGPMPMPDGSVIEPTGNTVTTSGVTVQEIEGGLLKRQVFYFDNLAFMQQLGVIPTAAPAAVG